MSFALSVRTLSVFSHKMATMLEAGLNIRRALSTVEKNAHSTERRVCRRLRQDIENGSTLGEALERQGRVFPVLYRRLIIVGEATGGLDKVFAQLAKYYDSIRTMRRQMVKRLIYPVCEYFAFVVVMAGITWIRASFVDKSSDADWKAIRVLFIGVGVCFAPIILYKLLAYLFGGARIVHEVFVRLPLVGWICRTFALARFSWAMEMMTDAGVQIFNAVTWGLQATSNEAYTAQAKHIIDRLKEGALLSEALQATGLFPHDYIEMLSVGEESGSMPVSFRRLSRNYFEKLDAVMKAITVILGWVIWMVVAGVLAYVILKMAQWYASFVRSFL